MKIRKGEPRDVDKIVEAQLAMARESEDLQLDPGRLNKGVRGVFEKPSRGTYWIAEKDGQMAGMLLVVPEWSDWRNRDIWWIHSVYTWPEFRGQGVFRSLYEFLKKEIESRGDLGGIRLYVEQENDRAQKVYERCGMSSDHYFMYEWLKAKT